MEYNLVVAVVISLYTVGCVGQTYIEWPENTAAQTGERTQLNCSIAGIPGTDAAGWTHYLDDDTGDRIWDSSNGMHPDAESKGFQVTQVGDRFDLVIPSMTNALAGRYRCSLLIDNTGRTVELVAVSDTACDPYIQPPPMPPNPPDIQEGAMMTFTCDVDYRGYKVPMLEWYNPMGKVAGQQYIVDEENFKVRAIGNATASAQTDEMMFECRVEFLKEEGEELNPPMYMDSCMSYYLVNHAPTNMEFFPDPADYPDELITLTVGDEINCTASGRPEPDFYWFDTVGDLGIEDGQVLTITEERVGDQNWTCRARNRVNGVDRDLDISVRFYAEAADNGGDGGPTEPWVIAVATIVPLLVIGTIVIVGVFFVMRNKDKNEKGKGAPTYDNRGFPQSGTRAPDEPGPPTRQTSIPPLSNPVSSNPEGKGRPVAPYTQQGYPGKGSPGFADLGIKGIHGSAASSLNVSHDSLQVSQFMGGEDKRHSQTSSVSNGSVVGNQTGNARGPGYTAGNPAGYGNPAYQKSPARAAPQQAAPNRGFQPPQQQQPGYQQQQQGAPQRQQQAPPRQQSYQPPQQSQPAAPQQSYAAPQYGNVPQGYQPQGYQPQGYQPDYDSSEGHAAPYSAPPNSDTVV